MSALRAQVRHEVSTTLRNGEQLLLTLIIPVLLLVFFSVVDVLPTDTPDPVDFLAPGILALAVMSSAMVSLGIGTGFERSYKVLKRGGLIVCLMAEPYTDRGAEFGVTVKNAPILPRKDILEGLVALVAQGKMRVFVEHDLPITDFQRAQELSQSWRVRGKIVLQVRKADGTTIG